MSSSCEHVFSTPELLETILSYLPLADLLHAQLISSLFHTNITSSPTLQQLLFFRPAHHSPEEWTLNPLLRQPFLPFFVCPTSHTSMRRNFSSFELLSWTASDSGRDAFLRADASWRTMVFMQPAPTSLSLVSWTHAMRSDFEATATVPLSGPVTMGLIYDVVVAYLRTEARSFPDFGLAVHATPAGPKVTLYFKKMVQCCRSMIRVPNLSSKGAQELEVEWKGRKWDEEADEVDSEGQAVQRWPRNRRLSMKWTTEMGVERGGVGQEEWRRWVKERKETVGDLMEIFGEDEGEDEEEENEEDEDED
jgi:hypothetical protein